MSLRAQLDDALATAPRLPRDSAMVELAKHYAATLDTLFDLMAEVAPGEETEEGEPQAFGRTILAISRIGARYEATLDRLGMTPGARPAALQPNGGQGGDPSSAALDGLRTDAATGPAAAGVDYAAAVDPAVADADSGD